MCIAQPTVKTKRNAERQDTDRAERPSKKRKVDSEPRKTSDAPKRVVKAPEDPEKAGQKFGSMIGRKRKARKAGKGT